jgi:nucleoid-associated protein YgaU
VGKPIKIEQTKVKKKEETAPAKPSKGSAAIIGILCAAVVLLSIFLFSLNSKLEKQLSQQGELMEQLAQQQAQLEAHQIEIGLQNTFIQNQDKQISSLKDQLAALQQKPEDETVKFKAYTVVAGDSLSKICAANGLEYGAVYKTILAINGIEDPNQIYVGQVILLPILN